MGMEPDKDHISNSNNGLPRAQSNLEILSQTASVIEESIGSAQTSPFPARIITPADQSSAFLLEQHCRKSFLSLPDMSGQQQQQPSIVLEQKKGFLPPALQFEGSIHVGGQLLEGVEASPYYSPGLFLSYSNGSSGTTMMGAPTSSNEQFATVTTGSEANSNNSAATDVAVNSFLSANSFSSGGASSAGTAGGNSGSSFQLTGANSIAAHAQLSMQAAFVPPRPPLAQRAEIADFSDEAARENFLLRQQLAARDATIGALNAQVESLQQEIRQLRQLPTGKISQIPLEDMLSIMREYGSEVSDTAMPPRKSYVQKASVVRQFRRWNPNFLDWFEHISGKWVPKLGKAGELKRRQDARRVAAAQRKKKGGSPEDDEEDPSGTFKTEI